MTQQELEFKLYEYKLLKRIGLDNIMSGYFSFDK